MVLANGPSGQYRATSRCPVSAGTIQVAKGTGDPLLRAMRPSTGPPAGADVPRLHGSSPTACRSPRRSSSLARSDGVDGVLSNLRLVLLLVFLGGIALAAALGRLAGRPRARSTRRGRADRAAIGETDDLSRPDRGPRRRRGRRSWRPASTRCSSGSRARARRSTSPSAPSASSSPTPRTSCARRSPACARTSRCCSRAASSTTRTAAGCWPTWSSSPRS